MVSAEQVSDLLQDELTQPNGIVDHYREYAIWNMAIVEALASLTEISSETAQAVRELIEQQTFNPKIKKAIQEHL